MTAVGRTRVLGRIVARLRFDDPITVVDHLKLSNPELDALGSARRNAVVLTTTTRDGRSFEARRDTRSFARQARRASLFLTNASALRDRE